jgi:hypothetical protein
MEPGPQVSIIQNPAGEIGRFTTNRSVDVNEVNNSTAYRYALSQYDEMIVRWSGTVRGEMAGLLYPSSGLRPIARRDPLDPKSLVDGGNLDGHAPGFCEYPSPLAVLRCGP